NATAPTQIDTLPYTTLFRSLEEHHARAGHLVSSNARNHRMDPLVPLVIPEVNRDHIDLLDRQKFGKGGGILTNPNCSTIVLVMRSEEHTSELQSRGHLVCRL